MEFLNQAVEYVKQLEEKIARLEKENAAKDQEIRRLSTAAGKAVSAEAPAPKTEASEAPTKSASSETTGTKRPFEGYTRITIPKHKEPSQQDKEAYTVYEDDAALGQKAPSMGSLKWFNGEPVEFGNGKPV